MVKAIRMHETGGPEVLRWEDYDPGQPGPGLWGVDVSTGVPG